MLTDVSEVRTASIIRALMMIETVHAYTASVNIYLNTRQYIPEGSTKLHNRRRENLKSHILKAV
jgi:hypothetical protein